ncbi:hypothetical protein EK21DRAFT_100911 [Setomelanomma holmii]|uniref:Fe2OG dioxygenase domain-containing protein n=1 Tax=Setomelanomma holmii TaxID=210430 RepID=A0A9P4H975_9PLEO|nr:hypothetical protein EK21DRAFT_100911 [Setomelanomma holmii]
MAPKSNENVPAKGGVTDKVTQALSDFLKISSYACGGAIHVQTPEASLHNSGSPDRTIAALITVRWDSSASNEKVTFPLPAHQSDTTDVQKLVQGTQPASFGFKGQDVIDESYRKASKLDSTAFSTNFCPYELGIIDVIGQTLLPRLPGTSQGIRAELNKLNIYQAPSGIFKPHVDTPRTELQFGSLVVSLPCRHEGGQLVVRHQGHEITFDWSGSANDIQWAAFYSDCEHEVLEVTSGHRITLTYNLFVHRGLGELAGHSESLNAQSLPLFKAFKEALSKEDFMAEGGILGKYCSHAYVHATKEGASALPALLKGSDMVAFEVFRALGIMVLVRPVVEHISKHAQHINEMDEKYRTHDHVGRELSALVNTKSEWGDYMGVEEVYDQYPNDLMKVTSLNEPIAETKNLQFAFMTYGNQSGSGFAYSFCALLFKVPSYAARVGLAKKHGYTL